ncbi:hypothetical protein I6A60_15325 [Frankia sp. AgB1.9]|uniref:hypothetical protein n=1 Tax=unclassified Frankia TaxID=2632575 RepID=UPI0019347803|nr:MULTISPECIES: hypothetical protein [unclassified Frankia]MBL7494019.1 hypothetical protein [Frankia sp. AgW1.1]MBL7549247.1 hypothetical protein [Frankia sp. AgB1.9]MBL7619464.1 hypothetical protein [Frankia sp. AgB1.8]
MKARHIIVAAALCVSLAACGGSSSTTVRDSGYSSAGPGTPTSALGGLSSTDSAPVSVDGSVAEFCAGARKIGLEQKLNLSDGSAGIDPSLLPDLDALAARAPAEIAPDFTLFVKLEHALLGATPDPATLEEVDSPATEARLVNVSNYLQQHCDVG